ncbi:MAG: carbohydrate binding domain-containing protein [Victivallales bacterium]
MKKANNKTNSQGYKNNFYNSRLSVFQIIIILFLSLSNLCMGETDNTVADNLVRDCGFENGYFKHWGISRIEGKYKVKYDTKIKYEGKRSVKIINEGTIGKGDVCTLPIKIEPNKLYNIKLHVKAENATSGRLVCIFYRPGKNVQPMLFPFKKGTYDWSEYDFSFISPKDATAMRIYLRNDGKGTLWFDQVNLNKSEIQKQDVITYNGQTFLPRPRYGKARENALSPRLCQSNKEQGYIVYMRENPRYLYPESIPQPEEINNGIRTFACPEQYAAAWFMMYSLENLKRINVKIIENLTNAKGDTINKEKLQIKTIKFWPQRTTFSGTDYYIIPERLEKNENLDLSANKNLGFWLQIKIPGNTQPGDYKTKISVSTTGKQVKEISFNIKVLPFKLAAPDNMDWIMYSDSRKRYNDTQLYRYFKDIKEYGITGVGIDYVDKRHLQVIEKIGFKGPLLLSLWWSPELMGKLLNEEGFIDKFKQMVENKAAFLKESNLTNCYCQLFDEPGTNPTKMKASKIKAEILQAAGIKTSCTVYQYESLKALGPVLDADVTGFIGGSEEVNLKYRLLAEKYNVKLFYLGGGIYTGQEGGLMPDRYYAGFLSYKSKASAHVSWAYQRPVGSPDTDFDNHAWHRESKDACITYPAARISDREVTVSTLQWEGIREGIDDYKYIHTLNEYIKKAQAGGFKKEAAEARKKLDELIDSVPWGGSFQCGNSYGQRGNFSNDIAARYRWMIALEIMKLQKTLGEK